ncbi:MAG: branched-chain amino acid ABC transporter permease [Anaerolineae bacterium]
MLEAIFGHYTISILIFCGIWAVLTLSLNVLTGYAGQVSLGHAAFFGIGAYTSALLTTRYGWPFLPAFLGAILVTAAVGGFLGLPSLRVRHDFLVLATMGVNFVVVAVFKYMDFFGGSMGIINIRKPVLFGVMLGGEKFLLFVLAYLALTIWVCRYISRTWVGLAFHTVRADEEAAEAVGVSVPRFKVYAFIISGALAGGAGGLYAHFLGSIFPDHFAFVESIVILSMLVFGGIGTIRGAVLGAMLLKALPEYLRIVGDYRYTLYGGILVLMMLFQPMGIIGDGSWLWKKWQGWRKK